MKYITFSVAIEKEATSIGKNIEEITKNISYRLQPIDSTGFMASSLSNLIKILLKQFRKLNFNMDLIIKNVKLVELNTRNASVVFNTQAF